MLILYPFSFLPHSCRGSLSIAEPVGPTTNRTADTNDELGKAAGADNDAETAELMLKSREVSPKLVVAGKKYGRRSRPQSAAFDTSSQSDSDGSEHTTNNGKLTAAKTMSQDKSKAKASQKVGLYRFSYSFFFRPFVRLEDDTRT